MSLRERARIAEPRCLSKLVVSGTRINQLKFQNILARGFRNRSKPSSIRFGTDSDSKGEFKAISHHSTRTEQEISSSLVLTWF